MCRHWQKKLPQVLSVLFGLLVVGGWSFAVRADLWCTGYYPAWEQSAVPPASMDFKTLTHVIQFAVVPNADGSLNSSVNSVTPANSSNLVFQAHAAGRKVLVCVGGAESQAGFQGATAPARLGTFITNIVNFVTARGYDGVDLDWEPLDPGDAPQFTNLVIGLRAALNAINPRPLLTAAMASPPTPVAFIASVQGYFDQINIMTYDMSGPYEGWVTWFNSPIYNGGFRFPSNNNLVPAIDGLITSLTNAGVAPGKLGVGIPFYGWIWSGGQGTTSGGAALPRQAWTTAPSTTQLKYKEIMATLYQPDLYRWDSIAQVPYLTINPAGSGNDKFVSYDDARSCQAKVSFARNRKLGGVFIWQIAQDHDAGQTGPLMNAIKEALATPGKTSLNWTGQAVQLSFNTVPLGSYRAQWTTSVSSVVWNTLVVTNAPPTGGVLQISDPDSSAADMRFYRVQTPP